MMKCFILTDVNGNELSDDDFEIKPVPNTNNNISIIKLKTIQGFTEDELLLLFDLVGNAIEHGYPITITRRLVIIYDKIDKLIEKE